MAELSYPLGKLPADHLAQLLQTYHPADPRLIIGGQVGEDAAVIDMGDRYLIAKTDPITFATDEIGWYAVNINANDVACTGATPKWFLATILLPEAKSPPALVDSIFSQITAACTQLGITLAGGHTEITYGLDRPLIVGQMLGEVAKDKLVTTAGAQPGDDVLLTKRIAIEATTIIAAEMRAKLQTEFDLETLDRLANYLHDPGISVVPEARIAGEVGGVHAMHDPTEGGIATGLWELATAAQVGLALFAGQFPFDPNCQRLCQIFGLDMLGIIASGSLLLTVDAQQTPILRRQLARAGIEASVIGQVRPAEYGVKLIDGAGERPLPSFDRDEITHLFE